MAYSVSISVIFDLGIEEVFDAICLLDNYPLWNNSMTKISKQGYLKENMIIQTEAIVVGQTVRSNIEVTKVVRPTEIEMINNSGPISYRSIYHLISVGPKQTEVVSMLQFEFRTFSLQLARPLIEAMAEGRLRGNLETLRGLLSAR